MIEIICPPITPCCPACNYSEVVNLFFNATDEETYTLEFKNQCLNCKEIYDTKILVQTNQEINKVLRIAYHVQ